MLLLSQQRKEVLNARQEIRAVSLDISRAFDTVWHPALVTKQWMEVLNARQEIRAVSLDISRSFDTVWHPALLTKLSSYDKLSQDDMRRRLDMCNWLSDRMSWSPNWINLIWFSDEAHFHFNGVINKHSNIFWGAVPPEEITERYVKGPKVTCFCTFNARWWYRE